MARNRWKLEVCEECGCIPCDCGENAKGPIHSILDVEQFDNIQFNLSPANERSAEELIAEHRASQLAGV